MKVILLATTNTGKLKEFQAILNGSKYTLVTQALPTVEETGLSFIENALLKARAACHFSGLPAITDDSGLVVPALNGAPGIYSSRYAGVNVSEEENRQKLLQEIVAIPSCKRQAYFYCSIVLLRHEKDPTPLIAQATWQGEIIETPRGSNGFGYDSLFYIPALHCTAAELSPEEKNTISHRGQALQALQSVLFTTELLLR